MITSFLGGLNIHFPDEAVQVLALKFLAAHSASCLLPPLAVYLCFPHKRNFSGYPVPPSYVTALKETESWESSLTIWEHWGTISSGRSKWRLPKNSDFCDHLQARGMGGLLLLCLHLLSLSAPRVLSPVFQDSGSLFSNLYLHPVYQSELFLDFILLINFSLNLLTSH